MPIANLKVAVGGDGHCAHFAGQIRAFFKNIAAFVEDGEAGRFALSVSAMNESHRVSRRLFGLSQTNMACSL